MQGSKTSIVNFISGANQRFIIPVYQRKYSWKEENCRQLYEDLKKIIIDKRSSHFFGSIVSSVVGNGAVTEHQIIDGQQRLTTVYLLFLAMRNLLREGKLKSTGRARDEQINENYLINKWANTDEDTIKLVPVKDDREALKKLFGDKEDYDPSSQLTLNYKYFCRMLLREEVTLDELYEAVCRLEIISITLDVGDNAQLIFESLNSTGLALTEGDKIRNYVLMGLSPKEQTEYYNNYWIKIEKCTQDDVSGFVRDYLSIKTQSTPSMSNVYHVFKSYAANFTIEKLLIDLLAYARRFEKLLTCKSNLAGVQDKNDEMDMKALDSCLYRLKRLEIVVTRPFFMEVFKLNEEGKLSVHDVLQVFLITENYLFRRNICEVPTNALNKVFLTLNREILRYDNTANQYVDKMSYALTSKQESGRFPDDGEFTATLSSKQVYLMRGKYKEYLFERYENYGTISTKDVYEHLENGDYSIEHIMPQHLSPAWVEELGENAEEIHKTWVHRLANLTLTGNNSALSNKTFAEKKAAMEDGVKVGLKMNLKIIQKSSWGLPELEERDREMVEQAKQIWFYPVTDYVPQEKEFESCTLDDENYDLTGRKIVKYRYQNAEQPIDSWADMFERIVSYLHNKDHSVLLSLSYGTGSELFKELSNYVKSSDESLRSPWKVDENIYIERNISTELKISILRKLFTLYDADPMDLVFYLADDKKEKESREDRFQLRKRYWTYALPIIQDKNKVLGTFRNVNPRTDNWLDGYFGIGGFFVRCVANYDSAMVRFYMGKEDAAENKKAFDMLFSHRDEIERDSRASLLWNRNDDGKASWVEYSLDDVSVANESDWPMMAKFHAEWSCRLRDVILPYFYSFYSGGNVK